MLRFLRPSRRVSPSRIRVVAGDLTAGETWTKSCYWEAMESKASAELGSVGTGDLWVALYTQPHKEQMVSEFLQGEGLEVYLPQVRNKVQRGDRRSLRPFFPHYLFLQHPGAEKLAEVRWTPGLRQIVAFGNRPALIPDQLIQSIRKRLKTFELGDEDPFKPGQKVRIIRGPFEGMEAIFDQRLSGKDRVRVFFELVNRLQVSVEMSQQDLLPPS